MNDLTKRKQEMTMGKHIKHNSPEFIMANEAAAFLAVSRRTFERWKEAGLIPHIRMGRVLRYRKADLIKAMESMTVNKVGE